MATAQHDQRESDLPMDLAKPARRALIHAGYWRLDQLTELNEAEIKHLYGVGPKAVDQLHRALGTKGLSFAVGKRKVSQRWMPR